MGASRRCGTWARDPWAWAGAGALLGAVALYAGIMSHGTARRTGSAYCEARYAQGVAGGAAPGALGGLAPGTRLVGAAGRGAGGEGGPPGLITPKPSEGGMRGAGVGAAAGVTEDHGHGHGVGGAHGGMAHDTHGRNEAEVYSSPHGGSFRGHAGPFAMFTVWATYWMVAMTRLWLLARREAGNGGAELSLAQPWFYTWGSNVVGRGFRRGEPLVKVSLSALAAWSEIYFHPVEDVCYHSLIGRDGFFDVDTVNLWVHALMYGGFTFSGMTDLLAEGGWLPPGWAKAAHLVAFSNTAFMFSMHLGGSEVNMKMHTLLLAVFLAYIGVTLADFALVTCHSLSLLRPGLLFLLGSWFLQVGLTSFGIDNEVGPVAPWDHQQHQTGMAVPVVFAFHVFGCFGIYGALLILAQAVAARGFLQPLEKHEHAYFATRSPGARAPSAPPTSRRLHD